MANLTTEQRRWTDESATDAAEIEAVVAGEREPSAGSVGYMGYL